MARQPTLPAMWDVPDSIRKRLGSQAGRQRMMFAEGHLLLILHAPPKPDETVRKGRFFWRQPDGTWRSDSSGGGTHALSLHLDEFTKLLEDLEQQDERAVSSQDYFEVIHAAAPIRRATRNLHETLQKAREVCPDDTELINLRDRAYQLERQSELLYSDAKNGLDCAVAARAEQQAESSHQMSVSAGRLNVLVAFFFPIATLSAVFGVNLRHGFEQTPPPIPFVVVLLLGLLLGFGLKAFVHRKV